VSEPTRRETLEELRDLLLDRLLHAPPSAVAGIAREYRATLAELTVLGAGTGRREEGSKVDELAEKRAKRRTATPD
jgi:hypothetical protein